MVGESNRLMAQIRDDGYNYCMSNCGDPECKEWATLWTEPDPKHDGKRHMLCHVNECEMFDESSQTPKDGEVR